MTEWEDIFVSTTVPDWIDDFDRDPLTAVDEALRGRYYFDHLNVAEPSELLIDWAIGIGARNDFVQRLDQALAQWINSHWGQKIRNSATATAMAWIRLTEVVANVDSLQEAPRILREYFDDRQAYLGPLSEGPSRDPLGMYIYAVARHQKDRSLLPIWWQYCDLVPGIYWYHGLYGIWGLRRLPPATEEERGRFPEHVVIGLARLAVGLYRRSVERSLSLDHAKAEFQRVARLTLAAYPFPERWRECWADYISSIKDDEPVNWMRNVLPVLAKAPSQKPKRSVGHAPSPNWKNEADRIVTRFQRDFQIALLDAEELLGEERLYAEKTGDSFHLCRSLCRFANAVWDNHPDQAVKWAEEARLWEPWNAYTWTTLTHALQKDRSRGVDTVLAIAWEAVERFPDNVVARNGLAEVLKAAGRLPEAEAVYRETIVRFPDDVVARSGLAEVLKTAGGLPEAEAVYRETIARFPDNVVARNGLAEVLKAAGRLEEAEAVYRETIARFPNDAIVRTGLAEVLKAAGRLAKAEAVYRETIARFPDNVVARTGLAAILRLLGKERLSEALALVEQTLQEEPSNAIAWREKANILEDLGRLQEANAALERARECVSSQATTPAEYGLKIELPSELEEKARQHISHAEVIAITAHARFLRRWARRNESSGEQPNPAELRVRAVEMLDKLILALPSNVRARSEKGLLLLESGQLAEAKDFLKESVALFLGETTLTYALARVEREIARQEKHRLHLEKLSSVNAAWNRLRELNSAFRPLGQLGAGRAWLAYVDGQVVNTRALNSFEKIRKWMRPHLQFIGDGRSAATDDPATIRQLYAENKGFEKWWSREVQAYLFGPINISADLKDEHLDVIKRRLEQYAHPIDTLEEDFAIRLSF